MTAEEWIYIVIGLSFVAFSTARLVFGKKKGGVIRRVGRWLLRVYDALMGM